MTYNRDLQEDKERLFDTGDTESEHSAMTACLAASATGAPTYTASASASVTLMHEMLFVASGSRAPIVMSYSKPRFLLLL